MRKEQHTTDITYYDDRSELSADERDLLTAAEEATEHSYAPYSHYHVGAAVLLNDGTVMKGSNQENASYGLSLCAERTTLFHIGAMGRAKDVRKIAITARAGSHDVAVASTQRPVPPCGACRQVIKEFEDLAGQPLTILTSSWKGPVARFEGIAAILPFAFGPGDFLQQ